MASRRIEDLDPRIQQRVRDFLAEANRLTAPWLTFITDGYRTPQEQEKLYQQGRTTAGKIITNARGLPTCQSNHCKRIAIDVAFQKDGKLSYDQNLYKKIYPIAKKYGAKLGADWPSPDYPHLEWTGSLDNPPPPPDTKPMKVIGNTGFKVKGDEIFFLSSFDNYDQYVAAGKPKVVNVGSVDIGLMNNQIAQIKTELDLFKNNLKSSREAYKELETKYVNLEADWRKQGDKLANTANKLTFAENKIKELKNKSLVGLLMSKIFRRKDGKSNS